MGESSARTKERHWWETSSEQGGGGQSALDASRAVAVSCRLVQLIKAGFVFEGGEAVKQARSQKGKLEIDDAKWVAKFEQLKKCELPASRAQQLS